MGKIVLVLGGVKSGKTLYAVNRAKRIGSSVTYLATAIAGDKEMKTKIGEHKKMRPKNWGTIEEPFDLLDKIRRITTKVIIVDCINFWLTNFLSSSSHQVVQGFSPASYIGTLCKYLKKRKNSKINTTFIISNEVGLSLVPPNRAGRQFQDLLGRVNQVIANYSDEIYFLVAGIPLQLK